MTKAISCLIIDDDPDDQEIFLMCVKNVNKNINCKTCDDGVEAISLLLSNEDFVPDYIFLDVNMPKMNGIECLKELRKIERLQSTKIFMYSTTTESNMVKESKTYGADDFIIKPNENVRTKGEAI